MKDKDVQNNNEKFTLMETNFGINIENGTEYSIKLFSILYDSDPEVYLEFKELINHKWDKIYYQVFLVFILYLLTTIFFSLQNFTWEENRILIYGVLTLICVLILAFLEIIAAVYKESHFNKIYNLTDLIVFILVIVAAILNIKYKKSISELNLVALFSLNLRVLLEFRVIEPMRHLI